MTDEKKNTNLICPIISDGDVGNVFTYCEKDQCALWVAELECCAHKVTQAHAQGLLVNHAKLVDRVAQFIVWVPEVTEQFEDQAGDPCLAVEATSIIAKLRELGLMED